MTVKQVDRRESVLARDRRRVAAGPGVTALGIALAWANDDHFPVQFHTGFGDPTVFLRTANPITLRDALESSRHRL
ncbi:MAG TPA: hypothetical protein VFL82_12775 [Thermomicrobiales bacterium]|nr:hypothetical protein [Thermomicrobiales bacterium]